MREEAKANQMMKKLRNQKAGKKNWKRKVKRKRRV